MMTNQRNFKRSSILTIIGMVLLILGTGLYYSIELGANDSLKIGDYIFLLAIFAVIVVTVVILLYHKRNYDLGLTPVDELTKKATYKAGYYSWMATLWITISVMMFKDLIERIFDLRELKTEHQTGIVVFSSVLVFFLFTLFFTKRGEVD